MSMHGGCVRAGESGVSNAEEAPQSRKIGASEDRKRAPRDFHSFMSNLKILFEAQAALKHWMLYGRFSADMNLKLFFPWVLPMLPKS